MKLFTVREEVHVGFELTLGKDMHVCGIDVGGTATAGIEKSVSTMIALLKKNDPSITFEGTKVRLDVADLVEKDGVHRIIKEKSLWDHEALVLVQTMPGVGGEVKLMAGGPIGVLTEDRKRVQWKVEGIETAIGVTVEAEAIYGDHGEKEFLVHMLPGARFTITRTGNLNGAPPELSVRWEGRWKKGALDLSYAERLNTKNWEFTARPQWYRHT